NAERDSTGHLVGWVIGNTFQREENILSSYLPIVMNLDIVHHNAPFGKQSRSAATLLFVGIMSSARALLDRGCSSLRIKTKTTEAALAQVVFTALF
ncbi:MAG: hypothetical protein Q7R58_02050, partial [bacterium]|nr:hypothetical protein [bacterium]